MPFPADINYDRLVLRALNDIHTAIDEWMKGQPRSEEAFMNQITGKLGRQRRGCDVGLAEPVAARAEVALLHRKGTKQTDLFGSDLAVTIIVNDTYMKTAFFQFKKSERYRASIEKDQLSDALVNSEVGARSFVLTIDEARQGLRVKSVSEILADFDGQQKSKVFDCSDWTCISQWIWHWFSCDIAPESDISDPHKIELLLSQYIVDGWESPWDVDQVDFDLPPDYHPAKVWLLLFFNKILKTP